MTEETEAAARPELRRAKQRIVAAIEEATEARTLMGGDPVDGVTPRAALPRCRDAIACERRVLANGDTWDLSSPLPPERPRAPRTERPRLSVIRGGTR